MQTRTLLPWIIPILILAYPAGAVAAPQRGAPVPFVTIEAEAPGHATSGRLVRMVAPPAPATTSPELEASGRAYVALESEGQYWQTTVPIRANAINVRHCIPDAPNGGGTTATLSLYVNDTLRQRLSLSSKHAWLYGHNPATGSNGQSNDPNAGPPHAFWDETRAFITGGVQKGDTIRLQKDPLDAATFYWIDSIDLEDVSAPIPAPAVGTYLDVTSFGADGSDSADDTAAIQACISAAKSQGKIIWIPPGTYCQSALFEVDGVKVLGSGMWHTKIVGIALETSRWGNTGFLLNGAGAVVSDLAVDAATSTHRGDRGRIFSRLDACTNWRVENVWITHGRVGFWMSGVTNGVIRGCRVTNTYADGINLNRGSQNNLVEHNFIRGCGDDGIAILSEEAAQTVSTSNTLRFNTSLAMWWGHNCDLAGGSGHIIEDNYFADNANMAAFTINLPPAWPMHPLSHSIARRNTIVRGGGNLGGQQRGALWIYPGSTTAAHVEISDNLIIDAIFRGIHIRGPQHQSITFRNNQIENPGGDGILISPEATGLGVFVSNTVTGFPENSSPFRNRAGSDYTVQSDANSWP